MDRDWAVRTIASLAGMVGVAQQTDYSGSKHAAVGFTESLRAELHESGPGVSTLLVCPYYIDTGMFAGVRSRFSAVLPILQPDDVAMTPNGEIYFNPKHFKEDFALGAFSDALWFMHEMVHVWQHQLGYPVRLRGARHRGQRVELPTGHRRHAAVQRAVAARGREIGDAAPVRPQRAAAGLGGLVLGALANGDVQPQPVETAGLGLFESPEAAVGAVVLGRRLGQRRAVGGAAAEDAVQADVG